MTFLLLDTMESMFTNKKLYLIELSNKLDHLLLYSFSTQNEELSIRLKKSTNKVDADLRIVQPTKSGPCYLRGASFGVDM